MGTANRFDFLYEIHGFSYMIIIDVSWSVFKPDCSRNMAVMGLFTYGWKSLCYPFHNSYVNILSTS